ncbi:hypothetical protein FRB97_003152 [Tulasnella sp. 331]|nr:hypothetical protein FRB97_003152 [Tulasnella sp. 331]KAG8884412.1 hypothetical protein FRB98_002422 [Tulasnella sp. 332]
MQSSSSSSYPEVNRLSQLSSRTLSLVLERQRLASFSPGGSLPASQLTQISRNLVQLRSGIIEQESLGHDVSEAVKSVRQQWLRMRAMLGEEGLSIDNLPQPPSIPPPPKSPLLTTYSGGDRIDTPYTDDPNDYPPTHDSPPSPYEAEPHEMIGMQQQMMTEQDAHLDVLSQSINRQRDISIHIGSELEVHDGLLQDLDGQLDRTNGRLDSARRRLDQVARGTKNNASAVTIGSLIFILLILIVVFKT